MTQSEFIILGKLGGIHAAARKLGLRPSTVQGWVERGRIPQERWNQIIDAAKQSGGPKIKATDFIAHMTKRYS